MEHERDRAGDGGAQSRRKRPYEPPEIESQEIFETTALACGKTPGGGGKCNAKPKAS